MKRVPSALAFDPFVDPEGEDAGGAPVRQGSFSSQTSGLFPEVQPDQPAAATAQEASPSKSSGHGHRRETSQGLLAQHSLLHAAKMAEVRSIILSQSLIHAARAEGEILWFFDHLGLNSFYFEAHAADEIASHVSSLYSAKMQSELNGTVLRMDLESRHDRRAVLVCRSLPGDKNSPALRLEPRIEEQYLGDAGVQSFAGKYGQVPQDGSDEAGGVVDVVRTRRWKLHCFRTQGTVSETSPIKLRFFFVNEPKYNPEFEHPQPDEETRLDRVSDVDWLRTATPEDIATTESVMKEAVVRVSPVVRVFDQKTVTSDQDTGKTSVKTERVLIVAYRHGTTHNFLSGTSSMYHSLGYHSTTKFVEQFSNGITLHRIFLRPVAAHLPGGKKTHKHGSDGTTVWPTDTETLAVAANAMFVLPRTSLSYMMREHGFTPSSHAYVYAAWKFAFHFLGRQSSDFAELEHALARIPNASKNIGMLHTIRSQMKLEAFTEGRILEIISQHPKSAMACFEDFERWHNPEINSAHDQPPRDISDAFQKVKQLSGVADSRVFEAFLIFNRYILKTNFYKVRKLAYSFRLDPAFMPILCGSQYSVVPFGVFFVLGAEFRGFHVRFRDVSRGGIRLIRSNNREMFTQNVATVFDENYNLALTQDRKNKDIPEGGSKGTILLSLDHQDRGETAFAKYIDALLDLMLINKDTKDVIDHSKRVDMELLFLGPDEGTAGVMDYACDHAANRGYNYAMSFATGKTASTHGGIPHDTYGMTTRSVHSYVVGALAKMGLDESAVTKVQTGGPDGDLGSNEVKISKDKTLAIVDGSGVLYDADGIDRSALLALAEKRVMSREFPKDKLGPRGFFIDVSDENVSLPETLGGEVVESGFIFRNNFHLHKLFAADVFVPCGGRPAAININNVAEYLTPHPRFKIIVEGANLFITQEARLQLEAAGVVLYKDASANKGGVTSSSLEVLAALALTKEEYAKHMTGDVKPDFYNSYVQDVIGIVEANAAAEFERIWEEHVSTEGDDAVPRCVLTDLLSGKINDVSRMVEAPEGLSMWEDKSLRTRVLSKAVPKTLQDLLGGVDAVVERVPTNYMKATFAAYLASRYVYRAGMPACPEFAFFAFLRELE